MVLVELDRLEVLHRAREPPWCHGLSIAALTVIVVLVLFTVYRIEYPFTGNIRIGPDAFEIVLHEIERDNAS